MKINQIKKYILILVFISLLILSACQEHKQTIDPTSVSFNESSITLDVGDEYLLDPIILPSDATNKTLTYASDSTHFTVTPDGLVKALTPGSGTVTVNTINDLKATITVTVKLEEVDEILVSNIIISMSTLELEKDENFQINATIIPSNATNKTLNYVSSDESIIVVSNSGLVQAKQTGTASVTISSINNVKTTLNVIVKEQIAPITTSTLGNSLYGYSHTSGFDLTHLSEENPYIESSELNEQRIYFEDFNRSNYIVSAKIKSKNKTTANIPKAGIIVGQNESGIAAVSIDFKTGIEIYAGYRTTTGQWDWLEPGGNSNAPVAVSPLIDLVHGTTLNVVRLGNMMYVFINNTYIFKREIPNFGLNEAVGIISYGAAAVFSDYYVSDDSTKINQMMSNMENRQGKSVLTIGDSLFDFYDDAINDTIQSFIYESGYTHFYKDNVGGSKITPEVNLTGRSTVNHIDVGTYEAYDDLDLIIIQRGTNDVANWRTNNVIKGEIGDGNKNTTFGAMAYIMNYFRIKHPNARIIWSTIIYRADTDFVQDHETYNNAVYEIAQSYNVEVFDLRTAIGINQSNYSTYLSGDKLHLSAQGEIKMKNAWLNYLDDVLPENRVNITASKTNYVIDLASTNSLELTYDVTGTPAPSVTINTNSDTGFTVDPLNPNTFIFDTVGQYVFEVFAENEFDSDLIVFNITIIDSSSQIETILLQDNYETEVKYLPPKVTNSGSVNVVGDQLVYHVGATGGSAFVDYLFDHTLQGVVGTEITFKYDGSGNASFMNLLYMYSANNNATDIGGSIAYSFAVGGRNDQSDHVAHLRVNRMNNTAGSDAISYNGSYIYINKNQTYTMRVITDYTNKINHLYFKGGDFNNGEFEFIGTFGFRNESTVTRVLRTGSDKANSTGYIDQIKVYSVEN
ncbi:Ig-like domain-containing protein [Acholeplasma granularum]|uniref:Ig-like domain-containing protein n=1 Tax=Acholeplasma granularum TaxID=264635 RepID=UPI000470DE32|nr:Ig-like domain-containing protein [Acholeplasma granularum]